MDTWICYACETANDATRNPGDLLDTDDECALCGMSRPHSDAETTAANLTAELRLWLEVVIECPPTVEAFEALKAAAKYKRAAILRTDKRIVDECARVGADLEAR